MSGGDPPLVEAASRRTPDTRPKLDRFITSPRRTRTVANPYLFSWIGTLGRGRARSNEGVVFVGETSH